MRLILLFSALLGVLCAQFFPFPGPGMAGPSHTDYTKDAACVGAWLMNGASTSMIETDVSGHLNLSMIESSGTQTLLPIPPSSATVPAGYSGFSRSFARTSSHRFDGIDGDSRDFSGASATISIVGWVKPASIANSTNYTPFGKWSDRAYAVYLAGTSANNYAVHFALSANAAGSSSHDTATTSSYADGAWHHIAAVANNTDMRIYVDGVLANTPLGHTTGLRDGTEPFHLGFSTIGAATYYNGLLDEVAVFSRVLSPTEIAEIRDWGIDGRKGAGDGASPATPTYTSYYASTGATGTYAQNITELNTLCSDNGWTCTSAGTSVNSNDIRAAVITPAGGYDYTVVMAGGIHGDEKVSVRVLLDWLHYLAANPTAVPRKRFAVIGMLNPDGYVSNGRTNAHTADLNRNFGEGYGSTSCSATPDTHGANSEPETQAFRTFAAAYSPQWIVSTHGSINAIYAPNGAAIAARNRAQTALLQNNFGIMDAFNSCGPAGKEMDFGATITGANGSFEWEVGVRPNAEESNRFIAGMLAMLTQAP